MNKITSLYAFLFLFTLSSYGQSDSLFVLFLGNSYTNVNNLPQLTADLGQAADKILIIDSNTPGGYTLDGHSTNATTLDKIKQGKWDFVVLQEQSQIPTIDFYRYNSMYPAVERLSDSIKKYNPCANVVSYMTWGRRFGGQQCDDQGEYCSPVFVDFSHMQDSLESAYVEISNIVNAYISPVGMAWKKVLTETEIILHSGDDSHPNLSGSYLAACVFHSVFWNESPVGLSFTGGLNNNLALYLQQVSDSIVFYSSNDWNLQIDQPLADFSFVVKNDTVEFTNLSVNFEPATYFWEFGDEATSNLKDPIHIYSIAQDYSVRLVSSHCTKTDSISKIVSISPISRAQGKLIIENISIYPNPFDTHIVISSEREILNHSIEIFDINGQLVYSREIKEEKTKILALDFLLSGLYYFSVCNTNNESQSILKILKK